MLSANQVKLANQPTPSVAPQIMPVEKLPIHVPLFILPELIKVLLGHFSDSHVFCCYSVNG